MPVLLRAELSVALREVVVRNGTELKAAMAAAAPGDHIILEDGDYSGLYEMRRSGTPDAPIVIRARRVLGARIGIRGIVFPDPATHDVMVWGIDFKDCLWMPLNGRRIIFRRCRIWPKYQPNGAIAIVPMDCEDCRIDYCTLRLYTTDEVLAAGAERVGPNGSPWLQDSNYGCVWCYTTASAFASNSYPRRLVIERCRFEGGPSGVPYAAPNCQFVEPGGDPASTNSNNYPMNWILRLCYGDVPRDSTVIDIKGSACTLDRVHIRSRGGSVQIREGFGHRLIGCRFENTACEVQSHGHLLHGCAAYVRLGSGNARWSDPIRSEADMNKWRAAHGVQLHYCSGTVNVGFEPNPAWTVPAEDCAAFAHSGTINLRHASNWNQPASSPLPPISAITLSANVTGHDAPWVGIEG